MREVKFTCPCGWTWEDLFPLEADRLAAFTAAERKHKEDKPGEEVCWLGIRMEGFPPPTEENWY